MGVAVATVRVVKRIDACHGRHGHIYLDDVCFCNGGCLERRDVMKVVEAKVGNIEIDNIVVIVQGFEYLGMRGMVTQTLKDEDVLAQRYQVRLANGDSAIFLKQQMKEALFVGERVR